MTAIHMVYCFSYSCRKLASSFQVQTLILPHHRNTSTCSINIVGRRIGRRIGGGSMMSFSSSSNNNHPSIRYHTSTTSVLFSSSSSASSNDTSNKTNNRATKTMSYNEESLSGYKAPTVNWYPGHIAKAERTLSETLTSADVLLEIRDARIPKATSHPRVREWTVGKPRIVVLTRLDTVPKSSVRSWSNALNTFGAGKWDQYIQDGNLRHQAKQNMKTRGITNTEDGLVEDVIYVDAKRGAGMPNLLRAIGRAGSYVNEKRLSRGLRERPLRVAVLGYPNVG